MSKRHPHLYQNVLEAIGQTPLVRLNRTTQDVKPLVAAKLEFLNPGGSIKDRIALHMVEAAREQEKLPQGGTLVEGTSGNTGVGLAMVAAVHGYQAVFTMPDKMSAEKVDTLRGMGAEVVVTPTAVPHDDPRSYHAVALQIATERPGAHFPNQYDNPANPLAHYETTAPEIWEQTAGELTHIVIGIGTGGTISGVGRYLKERNPRIRVIGIDPQGSIYDDLFHGRQANPQTYLVEGVGQDEMPKNVDFNVIDEVIPIDDRQAFLMTRRLAAEEGIFAGGSSGFALAGALKAAAALSEEDYLVVLFPDGGSRYLSKIYNDAWMREKGFLPAVDRPAGDSE